MKNSSSESFRCRRPALASLLFVALLGMFVFASQLSADEPYARSRDYELRLPSSRTVLL